YIAAEGDIMVARASVQSLYEAARQPKRFEVISGNHTYAGENARSAVLAWLNALHPRAVATPV
ncbi:MAG: hypothetical protein ACREMT_05800, partial [Vulcanimicrobiaceae bacterium]